MARKKPRKPKHAGPTLPKSQRRPMHDPGRQRGYYDPGKNPQPRNTSKAAGGA